MLVVTAAEMRALDRALIEEIGVPAVVLMESAGRAVADVVGELVTVAKARMVVFAGPGNNGGDGFVAARHLGGRGASVEVVLLAAKAAVRGEAAVHLAACRRSPGVRVHEILDEGAFRALELEAAEVVIDALLGTGLQRDLSGLYAFAVETINRHPGIRVAVDIPSGLDSDRGIPLGCAVRADHTVSFAFPKRGLVTAPGFTHVGRLHVADIGIPAALAREHGVRAELLDDRVLAPLASSLHASGPLAHKGSRGHLLVVAGSRGKTGAAELAGAAALHAGAGLVTLAVPADVQPIVDGRVPELMTASYGSRDSLDEPSAWRDLEPLLGGKRAVAVGPGMPRDACMRPVLGRLVKRCVDAQLGLVIDADGLNHVAAEPGLLGCLDAAAQVVLTPHPGEAARLAGRAIEDLERDRIGAATALATRFGAVVVLKGARTVVSAPDGRLAICPTGGPALGSGGTGDVLTGIIGAFLARRLDAFDAACIAVYLHGAAGDFLAREREWLTAHDLARAVPIVYSRLMRSSATPPGANGDSARSTRI